MIAGSDCIKHPCPRSSKGSAPNPAVRFRGVDENQAFSRGCSGFFLRLPTHPRMTARRVTAWGTRRVALQPAVASRSEEHTSELQSLMRISYAVFCLKKKNKIRTDHA